MGVVFEYTVRRSSVFWFMAAVSHCGIGDCVMITKWFTEHPHSVGETYTQHAAYALKTAVSLAGLAVICVVHAAFPWLYTHTVSTHIRILAEQMKKRTSNSS